jgi:NADPH:quinone reductase-like Zn-dependent oxidoreductase
VPRGVRPARAQAPIGWQQGFYANVSLRRGSHSGLANRVQQTTGSEQIRLAIDAIGGDMVLRLADCLAEGGTVVNYGLLSGQPCQLGAHHTIFKAITLTGFLLQ